MLRADGKKVTLRVVRDVSFVNTSLAVRFKRPSVVLGFFSQAKNGGAVVMTSYSPNWCIRDGVDFTAPIHGVMTSIMLETLGNIGYVKELMCFLAEENFYEGDFVLTHATTPTVFNKSNTDYYLYVLELV